MLPNPLGGNGRREGMGGSRRPHRQSSQGDETIERIPAAERPDYRAIGRRHAVANFELLRRLGISAEDAESASMALAAAQTCKLMREGATEADLVVWLAGYVDAGKNLAIGEMTPAGAA